MFWRGMESKTNQTGRKTRGTGNPDGTKTNQLKGSGIDAILCASSASQHGHRSSELVDRSGIVASYTTNQWRIQLFQSFTVTVIIKHHDSQPQTYELALQNNSNN